MFSKRFFAVSTVLVCLLFSVGPSVEEACALPFVRGDFNENSTVDISDAVNVLRYLFVDGQAAPNCLKASDIDDSGELDLSDAIYCLNYLFAGGTPPPAPFPGCGEDETVDGLACESFRPCRSFEDGLSQLKAADGCVEVLEQLRERIREEMEETLDRNLETALRMAEGDWCFRVPPYWEYGGPLPLGVPYRGFAPPEAADDAADKYSTTNTQVPGVDEADFLKTDGSYIYMVSKGKFQIIDAWPPAEAQKLAGVEMEGTPKKLFVHGDSAVVYSSLGLLHERSGSPGPLGGWREQSSECTYGYDCDFTGDGRKLRITVFDTGDPADPEMVRELDFTGSYLDSRRIGNTVYTVVVFPEIVIPELTYWPGELLSSQTLCVDQGFPYSEEEVKAMFSRLRAKNIALIGELSLSELLPSVKDIRYGNGSVTVKEDLFQDCHDYYISRSGDGQSLLSVVSLDVDKPDQDAKSTTIIGKPGAVYASGDSLYIAARHYRGRMERWYFPSRLENTEATTIHKFHLYPDGGDSTYVGSGVVKGRVLNQFSMDQYEGYLRIATTTGRVPSPDVHSTVSVLAEGSGGLAVIGEVDNIAPTEDIRSVRFTGNTGFVVTFKKTDPLFVLDFSEPGNPVIRGELKIPGFSTYMHPMGETHLLSIGYDSEEAGSFAWFQGILLQLFDISDLDNPSLLHKEVIGTRGSTSDAATNHLAFNYFPPLDMLALPMVVCEGGSGGTYGDRMTFSGLMVYEVDVEECFEFLGRIPHGASESGDGVDCSNWWTRSNSQVKRSIFMEDFVYSVALDLINISQLEDLETPVKAIPLE